MSRVVCSTTGAAGPWWATLAVLDLFVLVLVVSFILIRHFDRRDARLRSAWQRYAEARERFMRAAWHYQAGGIRDIRSALTQLVMLGADSLAAFDEFHAAHPDAQTLADADWINTLMWVQSKARLFDVV